MCKCNDVRVLIRSFRGSLLCFLSAVIPAGLLGQGVNVGSQSPPHPSAVLEVSSFQQGMLPPRLSTAQRDSIQSPAIGLTIINTSTECMEVYFSAGWRSAACNCTQPPATPSQIQGSTMFCDNQAGLVYSIAPVTDASTYSWTVPSGAQIIAGQGTNSISVTMGSSSGTVSVSAGNTCGSSSPAFLPVSPAQPDASFSPVSGGVNTTVVFTPVQGNATYQWTFTNGSPATSTVSAPQVTWNAAGTYPVTLHVTDSLGCTDSITQTVVITTCIPVTVSLSTCGKTGHTGPSQSQCDATYGPGVVSVSSGIQQWTVPQTGTYRILAAGAKGGGSSGGNGAIMEGDFSLTQGDVLQIIVGQPGTEVDAVSTASASGGGGSFVVRNNTALIVAGGGGGNQGSAVSTSNATTASSGQAGVGSGGTGAGGTNGNGGQSSQNSGGGGGFFTNGSTGSNGGPNEGGKAFVNGGMGGDPSLSSSSFSSAAGGFGGGGVATDTGWRTGAGGGGYSGGGGGNVNSVSTACAGGGGGSINTGTNQANQNGANAQSGFVTITSSCQ